MTEYGETCVTDFLPKSGILSVNVKPKKKKHHHLGCETGATGPQD